MEWWAFYFEFLCRRNLSNEFQIPGERINAVTFDAKRSVNWDFKAKAIKSDQHTAILNDIEAMNESIRRHGEHGGMIALCDVEYNDENRTFQRWRQELEGGLSAYAKERMSRTSISRYRKTAAILTEILFVRFDADNVNLLGTMRQGRNSNGASRPPKYMLDLEDSAQFLVDRIVFGSN